MGAAPGGPKNVAPPPSAAPLNSLVLAEIIPQKFPAVLILVAVNAEIFPVGAVGGIIQVIAVLVVHRQQLPVFMVEFPAALGANHPVDLEGALPVGYRLEISLVKSSLNGSVGRASVPAAPYPGDLPRSLSLKKYTRLRAPDTAGFSPPANRGDSLNFCGKIKTLAI